MPKPYDPLSENEIVCPNASVLVPPDAPNWIEPPAVLVSVRLPLNVVAPALPGLTVDAELFVIVKGQL